MWYVYILECNDGSFYSGVTSDIFRRLEEHSSKKGSHYLQAKLPVKLLYKEPHSVKVSAYKREAQIKRWSKAKKQALITGDIGLLRKLSRPMARV